MHTDALAVLICIDLCSKFAIACFVRKKIHHRIHRSTKVTEGTSSFFVLLSVCEFCGESLLSFWLRLRLRCVHRWSLFSSTPH